MTTLALELSSARRSVALLSSGSTPPANPGESLRVLVETDPVPRSPLPLLRRLLTENHVAPGSIDRIAVSLGPGSYTGIRSALAVAQGWHLAHGTPIAGIGTFDLLARQAWELGWRDVWTLAIDAHRNEYYVTTVTLADDGPGPLAPPSLLGHVELQRLVGRAVPVAGPELDLAIPGARRLDPDAGTLASISLAVPTVPTVNELTPVYLRETTFVKAPPGLGR